MKSEFRLKMVKVLVASALASTVAFGATIYSGPVTALTADDPTQLGRISRSGVPSDWSTPKDFPGVINATTEYTYGTFAIPETPYKYIQVLFDSTSPDTFASAYLNSYDPTQLAINYAGDEGFSGNFNGTDPNAFQVILPTGNQLLLVVNTSDPAGIGAPFQITVEGYTDTEFDDTITPEPASAVLSGAGLLTGAALLFMRRRNARAGA